MQLKNDGVWTLYLSSPAPQLPFILPTCFLVRLCTLSQQFRAELQPRYSPWLSRAKIRILISYPFRLPYPPSSEITSMATTSWIHNCTVGKQIHGWELPDEGANAQKTGLLMLGFVLVIRGCWSILLWSLFCNAKPVLWTAQLFRGFIVSYLLLLF